MPFRHVLALAALFLALYVPGLASVPPLDRDEPRFMQASKQMLETGDYVDIRFQDETRYKKPVLIYWLQSASVSLFAGGDTSRIWAYRLPSVLGAVMAVLFTYATATVLVSRSVGIAAAILLASSLLLTVEAHIAKTDAMLLAAIAAGQFVLASLYGGFRRRYHFFLFWGALGIGMLLKGPVALLPALATVAGLGLWDRSLGWAKPLRPWFGIPFALLFFLPWLVAIIVKSDGAFLEEALVRDMLSKVGGGQESHGAPPGYYLMLLALSFWPGSLFLLPAGLTAWRARAEKPVRFLVCWILPVWLLFELIPTKLPHYALPVFPALAILCALALIRAGEADATARPAFGSMASRLWAWIWAGLGLVLATAFLALPSILAPGTVQLPSALFVSTAICAAAAGIFGVLAYRRQQYRSAVAAITFGALGLYLLVFAGALPSLGQLWVASRMDMAARAAGYDGEKPVLIAGFGEPSAVFLLGTGTRHGEGGDAARYLAAEPDALVFVEARHQAAFAAEASSLALAPEALATIRGLNYSRGDPVSVTLYRRGDG